jgi:outer membrane murein-binding lipoprotein Lpp
MKLLEDMIQEKKNIISDKRASMKKCELRSSASYSPMNTRKLEIIDTITIREEEILTLETKIKQINLEEYNLDIMNSTVESLEMEILILQKRLKVKQESMRTLELRFMNVNGRHDSQSNLNKYKDELTTNIKESERKLQSLNTEEEHVKESFQAAQKEISQWEIRLEEKKEEKLLIQKFKESNDLNATKKLEMNYHKIVEIRKSSDEILTQIHIMTAQLGNLSLEESALPAWPLHSCFRFKHEIEGICKYLDALNVIAG